MEEKIKEFTNEIVNRCNSASEIKKNVLSYKTFLVNTKLIKSNYDMSKWLDIVINSAELIMGFIKNDGYVDIVTFVESIHVYNTRKNKVSIDSKHYGHYHSTSSSGCGGSETVSDSCGSSRMYTQSSSCGGSVSTSRC